MACQVQWHADGDSGLLRLVLFCVCGRGRQCMPLALHASSCKSLLLGWYFRLSFPTIRPSTKTRKFVL